MQPHEMGVAQAAAAIREKRLTSVELVQDCLAAIVRREPDVRAWQHLDADQAMQQAVALDQTPVKGCLHGVPIGIKDIINTKDMPTEYGSSIYRGNRPVADAACVALLRRAGAVIMGKTVTTEFAFFRPGKTRNPRRLTHTPGGSSSGSAAAVADHMVPGALGSQTAGSIIRPASYCGVVGYKPSYGDFSLVGVKGLSHSLDTLGTLTRSVVDAMLLRRALLGGADEDTHEPSAHWVPSIALCRTPSWSQASFEVQAGIEKLLARLSSCGARVGEVTLPDGLNSFTELQKVLMSYEAARSLAYEFDVSPERLSNSIRELVEAGIGVCREDYLSARSASEWGGQQLEPVFERWDVLLAPSSPGPAPAGLENTGDPIFSRMWMLLGLPTLSLPAFYGSDGLPVGVQLVGMRLGDDRLFRCARWVERVLSDRVSSSSC
ncbi:MAG: amidase [Pusillimonas sp.]|nr:MAG: amidase [Pusillimonas sp.]